MYAHSTDCGYDTLSDNEPWYYCSKKLDTTEEGNTFWILGSLSNNVFERRKSTGNELFFLLICLDATKFVWLSVFTLIEKICPKFCSNHGSSAQKIHFRLTCVAQKRRCLNFVLCFLGHWCYTSDRKCSMWALFHWMEWKSAPSVILFLPTVGG